MHRRTSILFISFRALSRQIQRWYQRQRLARPFRRMRAGVALIQRQYRRYRVSKRAIKAIRIVRKRLQKATEEYCETNTLKYRSAEALHVLLRCKTLAGLTSHCRCLEMATRNSSQCAQVCFVCCFPLFFFII